MSHTLELLIILALIATTVLRIGSGLSTCSDEKYQTPVEKELQCPYKINRRATSINLSRYRVQKDFQGSIYVYAPSVTVQETMRVEQERCDPHLTVETNDNMCNATLSRDYECSVAAVANIASDGNLGFNKVLARMCHVYIFAKKDSLDQKCDIPDNLGKDIGDSAQHKVIDDNDVPEEIRSEVVDETLSSLVTEFCTLMKQDLSLYVTETALPLPLTVIINDAVDKSLIRLRANIENRQRCASNTELKNIQFSTHVTDGDIDGYVTFADGIFEDLSSIVRVGNATATIQPNVYNIRSTFTFSQARIHFDSYRYRSEKLPVNGTIYLIIHDLEIQLERSGFLNNGGCNESVWLNITKLSSCSYEFSDFQSDQSRLSNALKSITPTQLVEIQEMLGLYLVWNVLQYGVADYTNYIYGPCMSNSSKEWRHIYSSRMNFRFIQ